MLLLDKLKSIQITPTHRKVLIVVCILILFYLISILFKDWLKPRIIKGLGGYTQKEVKHSIDTISIKYNDIYIKYKNLESKASITKAPEYIPVYRYIPQPTTNNGSTTGKVQPKMVEIHNVKRYLTDINDTILKGNIETIISLDSCKIVTQSLKYEPKIPYIREKIITVVETKETILSQKPKAYIGIGMDVNTINQVTPQLIYLSKKRWLYKGGYIKSIDNKYPNGVTVGVAKLF